MNARSVDMNVLVAMMPMESCNGCSGFLWKTLETNGSILFFWGGGEGGNRNLPYRKKLLLSEAVYFCKK